MPSWRYAVPPDFTFSVLTNEQRPTLLSRTFGPEVSDGEPEIVLDIGGSKWTNNVLATTIRSVYKMVPWSCDVEHTSEAWKLRFRSLAMREYLAMHIALLPALRYELATRGVALVPGGAYEDVGGATVLVAPTGAGKTSLLLGKLSRGARFIGDEYVGLSDAGRIGRVVRSFALRRTSLALAPEAPGKLSASRRIGLRAAQVVTTLTQRRLEPLSHIRPEDMGLKLADGEADLKRLIWLEPSGASDKPALGQISVDEVVQKLIERDAVHQSAYGDISPHLEAVTTHGNAGAAWRRALEACLRSTECYRLRYSRERLSEAMDALGAMSAA